MSAQIITTDDLQEFKAEIIENFKQLLKELGPQPVKKWLKSPDVCRFLNISPGTLQTLRINGTLPFSKIGGSLYYDVDDIQKLLLENKKRFGRVGEIPNKPFKI